MLGTLIKWTLQAAGESARKEDLHKQVASLEARKDGICTAILAGTNLDTIAGHLSNEGIAPRLTLLYGAQMIRSMYRSADPQYCHAARRLARQQYVDSVVNAHDFLEHLDANKHVFLAEECVGYHQGSEGEGTKGVGILTSAYLYFLPFHFSPNYAAARAKGLASGALERGVPGFGVLSTLWEIGSGVVEGSLDFFQSHRSKLIEALKAPAAFVLPLVAITRYRAQPMEGGHWFLILGARNTTPPDKNFVLGPLRRDRKAAVDEWCQVLPLACIGEGILFDEPPRRGSSA